MRATWTGRRPRDGSGREERSPIAAPRAADWIIGLGEDYDYALVGTPSRRWGWILARVPRPSPQRIEFWLEHLREQGYDPKAFVLSDQNE